MKDISVGMQQRIGDLEGPVSRRRDSNLMSLRQFLRQEIEKLIQIMHDLVLSKPLLLPLLYEIMSSADGVHHYSSRQVHVNC